MRSLQRSPVVCLMGIRVFQCRRTATTAAAASHSTSHRQPMEVPGPRCYPVVGTLFDMIFDKDFKKDSIHLYFMKLFQMYGSVVRVKFPGQPTLALLKDPEDIKTILQATMSNPVRPPMESLKKARYDESYYEKKSGIVSENGEEWSRVATVTRPKVLRPNNIHQYIAEMDQVTLDFSDRISTLRDSSGEVKGDFKDELSKWSLESICLVSLNQRIGGLKPSQQSDINSEDTRKAATNFMTAIMECESGSKLWKIYPTKMFKQLQHSMDKLKETSIDVLQEIENEMHVKLRKDPKTKLTMVEQLLCSEGLTRKDIVTFMMDLIPGGTGTVADWAAVILYLVAKNPDAQKKVQEELDRVLGDGVDRLTAQHLDEMSYVKALAKEANRVLPPALGSVRILQEDVRLGNFLLQKGWMVFLMTAVSGWDPEVFKHPEQFLPERWLRHRPYGDIHPYASVPFSFGIRMCIGRRIAEQEIYIFIARILHRYSVEWKHGELERPLKHLFSPEGPLNFTFIDRHQK